MIAVKWTCGLLVLALPALALANGCVVRNRVIVHRAPVVVHRAAAVVKAAVVAEFVPLLVAVPQYTASYAAPGPAPDVQALLVELQRLRAEVQSLRAVPPKGAAAPGASASVPQQAPAGGPHPALGIFGTKCSGCHDASMAKAKGGGFTITQGGALVQFNEAQAFRIMRELYQSRMPKGGKLTDEEVGQVFNFLDSLK